MTSDSPTPSAPHDSLPSWALDPGAARVGRFILGPELGRGAIGRIVRAWDPLLTREVALKLLLNPDPIRLLRLCREAQLQAKVQHPYVCPIHEVGMAPGSPYIALPILTGQSLEAAHPSLGLTDLVRLTAEAAGGLQAAHDLGLTHRDVKPDNIMLEPGADGVLHPVLVDFGLAMTSDDPGLGFAAEGTPAYMSPQQAAGKDAGPADDIFALGTTLARISAGRSGQRDLPMALGKATAPDPAARYRSARDFAADLRRWLEGRPVLAGNPTRTRNLGAWVVRRRLRLVGLLAVLAALTWLLGLQMAVHRREQRVQALSATLLSQVQDLEATLRVQRMLPPHGIRGDVEQGREVLQSLESAIHRAGPEGEGPGTYALGRAHLALGDLPAALRLLERGEALGMRGPDFRFTLGRALGRAYQQGLGDLLRLSEGPARDTRRRELDRLKQRALLHLREGQSSRLAPLALQEGLLALFDGRHDEALDHASRVLRETPWVYEASSLQGEALMVRAQAASDRNRAWSDLVAAREPFRAASAHAPSDPRLRELEARRCTQALRLAWQLGRDPGPLWAEQAEAFASWRILVGDAPDILALEAQSLADRAFIERYLRGQDPDPTASEALRLASRVLADDPVQPDAQMAKATVELGRALWQLHTGRSPQALDALAVCRLTLKGLLAERPTHLAALEMLSRVHVFHLRALQMIPGSAPGPSELGVALADFEAPPPGPGMDLIQAVALGRIRTAWGDELQARGQDPRPALAPSLPVLRNLVEAHPQDPHLKNVLAGLHLVIGQAPEVPSGEAEASLALSIRTYQEALRLNPLLDPAWGAMLASGFLAERLLERGADARQALQDMEQAVGAMGHIQAAHWSCGHGRGWLAHLRARQAPQDPAVAELLNRGLRAVDQALAGNPGAMELHLNRCRLLYDLSRQPSALSTRQRQEAGVALHQAWRKFPGNTLILKEFKRQGRAVPR